MDKPASQRAPKRAVVIVHGMGNQAPLAMLRGMADALWLTDDSLSTHGQRTSWTKPEVLSGDYELRRISTSKDREGIRTDFFEFYWAHLMEGTRFASVLWWLQRLFLRKPSRVPEGATQPWIIGGLAMVLLVLMCGVSLLMTLKALQVLQASLCLAASWLGGAMAIWAALWILRNRVLVLVVGDAARYLTADPENIELRSKIRRAGLDLLEKLHDDPDYDRIIVVAHSLGTVVAYELLTFFWSNRNKEIDHAGPERQGALRNLMKAAAVLRDCGERSTPSQISAFQEYQHAYFDVVRSGGGKTWKISDFVTLGSPLTHAPFLMVNDGTPISVTEQKTCDASWIRAWHLTGLKPRQAAVAKVLSTRIAERLWPTCPPAPELPSNPSFTYEFKEGQKAQEVPNHSAAFAAVRWTNIHAPHRMVLWGDVVSGPLAPLFGPGVRDVELKEDAGRSFVAHVNYWNVQTFSAQGEHVRALRLGVNLLDRNLTADWSSWPTAPKSP